MDKKQLFGLLVLLLCCSAKAQIKWNASIGIQGSHQLFKQQPPHEFYREKRTGSFLCGNMDIRLHKNIWSETGLSWGGSKFGVQITPSVNSHTNFTYWINYLTLSQMVLLKVATKNRVSFSGGTGIFWAMAIKGKTQEIYSTPSSYTTEQRRLNFGNSSNDDFKRANAGLHFLLRAQFHKFLISLIYSHGLSNHWGSPHFNYRHTISNFCMGFGYEF